MRIRAVLFDIDGTLIDSNHLHVAAWQRAFLEAGHAQDAQVIHDQIGKGGDNLVPTLLPDLPEARRQHIADRHGAIFKADYLDQARPFPHARDLLVRTHDSGRRVVLASSASRAELEHYVDLLEAKPLLAATTSIDDVGTSKPAPDIFATALRKLGDVPPEAALAVGDTPYDVEAAARSGVATVALLSGAFSREALKDAVALYRDVADLLTGFAESPLNR